MPREHRAPGPDDLPAETLVASSVFAPRLVCEGTCHYFSTDAIWGSHLFLAGILTDYRTMPLYAICSFCENFLFHSHLPPWGLPSQGWLDPAFLQLLCSPSIWQHSRETPNAHALQESPRIQVLFLRHQSHGMFGETEMQNGRGSAVVRQLRQTSRFVHPNASQHIMMAKAKVHRRDRPLGLNIGVHQHV